MWAPCVAPAECGRLEQALEREQWELTAPFAGQSLAGDTEQGPDRAVLPVPSPRLGWFIVPVGSSRWAGLDKLAI